VRRAAAALALVLTSCSKGPDGGLQIDVDFDGFTPGCLEVTATDTADSKNTATRQVPVTERRTYSIAAGLGTWGRKWKLSLDAREASCTGKVVAHTEDLVEVPTGKPITKTYRLSATDGDGDGFVSFASGGTDCDDTQAMAAPGLVEMCGDRLDNDCKGGADCLDPFCSGKGCDDGDGCTMNDVCSGIVCGGVARDCGPPLVACRADAGACSAGACTWPNAPAGTPCGAGMACRQDGTCVVANTELNCADGLDDDNDDAGIDCADSDCAGAGCDAGLCLVGATCAAGACGGGTPKSCNTPPSCRDAGSCNPLDGTCTYPASATGSACDDGDLCTPSDTCNGSGACVAGPVLPCGDAGVCRTGSCDAGACVWAPAAGACDDDAGCTFGDTCAGGACTGTAYSCTNPPPCQQNGACLGDGGCAFMNAPNGSPCADGGYCGGGRCSGFPYAVSNIDAAAFPPGGAVRINCSVTFDSTDGGVSPGWCTAAAPSVTFTTQTGGEPVVVLSMARLGISPDAGLKLVGTRPVILLVWDETPTNIEGVIDARALLDVPGAGGGRASCGAVTGFNGGAQTTTIGAGAGAGGAGGATRGGFGGRGFYATSVTEGDGGLAATATYAPVVGGCSGGLGGRGGPFSTCPGCRGGAGGGGLQLSTAGPLRLLGAATVTVSGGGGTSQAAAPNTNHGCGGCGGGSGGMLLLEGAPLELMSGAWLTANGGGGSGGSGGGVPAGAGENGAARSTTAAAGAPHSGTYNGFGGAGASTGAPGAGESWTQSGNGGGGGGASGFIWLRSIGACTRAASFSPAATNTGGCP